MTTTVKGCACKGNIVGAAHSAEYCATVFAFSCAEPGCVVAVPSNEWFCAEHRSVATTASTTEAEWRARLAKVLA